MIVAFLIFAAVIGYSTLRVAFQQFHREKRFILGTLLYLFGGVTTLSLIGMIPLSIINGFYETSEEQFNFLWILLFISFCGAILSFGLLPIVPIWAWLSKITKRQAQQDAAANP